MNVQYVRSVSLSAPKCLICRGKIKGSKTVLRLILSEKKSILHKKKYTSYPLVRMKCCSLPGISRKHTKLVTFFVQRIDENRATFSNLEPSAPQSKLVHAYYVFPL